jgi:hypothetical protein
MTIEPIGFVALLIAVFGIFLETPFIVYAFLLATLLGSAAAFILDSLGGTNISPAHLLLGVLAVKLLSDRSTAKYTFEGLSPFRPGFWLLLTTLYSVLSAYFMPILFAGQTLVFAVRNVSPYSMPLVPDTANLTQSIYLVGNFVCFIVVYGYAREPFGRRALGRAALACVIFNLIFSALDLVTYATGTSELLAFIRNASYSLHNDSEVSGFKRIVGSFVEASSFGAATLGYFAFSLKLWLLGIRPRLTLPLSLLSLGSLIFSTSTTAYVGLAVFLLISYLEIFVWAIRRTLTPQMVFFVIGAPIACLIVVGIVALNDTYSAQIQSLLDSMVFNKLSTDSGVERSSWNRQALQNFVDTYGFGAGNGSLRASSFPIAVLASFGIVGTSLFGLFFIGLFFGRTKSSKCDPLDEANQMAAGSLCVAWLIAATVSGALTDLGLPFFAFAALACSDLSPVNSINFDPEKRHGYRAI